MSESTPLNDLATAVGEHSADRHSSAPLLVPAGIGIRMAAATIDIFLVMSVGFLAMIGVLGINDFDGPPALEARGNWIIALIYCGVAMAYSGLSVPAGRTLGKAAFALSVVADPDDRRLARLAHRWLLQVIPIVAVAALALVRLRLLSLQVNPFVLSRWDSDDFAAGVMFAVIPAMIVIAVIPFGSQGGRAWYDCVAGTRVMRKAVGRVRHQPHGFEPIMPPAAGLEQRV